MIQINDRNLCSQPDKTGVVCVLMNLNSAVSLEQTAVLHAGVLGL